MQYVSILSRLTTPPGVLRLFLRWVHSYDSKIIGLGLQACEITEVCDLKQACNRPLKCQSGLTEIASKRLNGIIR